MKDLTRIQITILFLSTVLISGASTSFAQFPILKEASLFKTSVFSLMNSCPEGYPLDCANGMCCPAGSTLYCPQMEPTPCIDPNKLTEEQLKTLSDHCSPLLSCH